METERRRRAAGEFRVFLLGFALVFPPPLRATRWGRARPGAEEGVCALRFTLPREIWGPKEGTTYVESCFR
jgi:hypothetical protein